MQTREYLLTGQEMTEADHYTSSELRIPSIVLMERAALAVASRIQQDTAENKRPVQTAVIAGKGNNGADALAAGRLLLDAGYPVSFYTTFDANMFLKSEASDSSLKRQLEILSAYGARTIDLGSTVCPANDESEGSDGSEEDVSARDLLLRARPEVIVDGIFGTGLSRMITGRIKEYIDLVNQLRDETGARVYSVDLPSGICASTGKVLGTAIQADVTVTFGFYKRGEFLYPGCEYCGELVRSEMGITARSLIKEPGMFTYRPAAEAAADNADLDTTKNTTRNTIKNTTRNTAPNTLNRVDVLPQRRPDGNKGTFGKVLIIAGSKGVSGACVMCAQAAFRCGAGMVRVITHEDNRIILQETVPEAMCTTYRDDGTMEENRRSVRKALEEGLTWADTVAAGPGMGVNETGRALLDGILHWRKDGVRGVVLDADAIRLLAENGWYQELKEAGERFPVVLTPHPGEMAALLGVTISELKDGNEEKNEQILQEFAAEHQCILMAKDARTRVFSPDKGPIYLNTTGNDGLATAGSGDVLAGMTAGLLAQKMSGFASACSAAFLHGRLAEGYAAENGTRSMTATDLLRMLVRVLADQ